MTSWEVWIGEPKADNIVSMEVGRYKFKLGKRFTVLEKGKSLTEIKDFRSKNKCFQLAIIFHRTKKYGKKYLSKIIICQKNEVLKV
jgi:hypothetical protein